VQVIVLSTAAHLLEVGFISMINLSYFFSFLTFLRLGKTTHIAQLMGNIGRSLLLATITKCTTEIFSPSALLRSTHRTARW
jgi:hypothetical protein